MQKEIRRDTTPEDHPDSLVVTPEERREAQLETIIDQVTIALDAIRIRIREAEKNIAQWKDDKRACLNAIQDLQAEQKRLNKENSGGQKQ